MTINKNLEQRTSAYIRLLQIAQSKSSEILSKISLLGFLALNPSIQTSPELSSLASSVGIDVVGSLIERLASGETISDNEISRLLEPVILENRIEGPNQNIEYPIDTSRLLKAIRRKIPDLTPNQTSKIATQLINDVGKNLDAGKNLAFVNKRPDNTTELFIYQFEVTDEHNGKRNYESHLKVLIPLPSSLTTDFFYETFTEPIVRLGILYSIFGLLYFAPAELISEFTTWWNIAKHSASLDANRAYLSSELAPHNNPQEALAAARNLSIASNRAEALAIILPYLSQEHVQNVLREALSITHNISNKRERLYTLSKLAPYMSVQQKQEVFNELGSTIDPMSALDEQIVSFSPVSWTEGAISANNVSQTLHRFLSKVEIRPLSLLSISYGSPASFDLLGIGKILEVIRDSIKDLAWRGKHEILMADIEATSKALENKKSELEIQEKVVDIAHKKIKMIEELRNLELPDEERKAITSFLTAQLNAIALGPNMLLTEDKTTSTFSLIGDEDNT